MEGDKVADGEIVYCNLTVLHKGKKREIKEVVYKPKDGNYNNRRVLNKLGIKEAVKILRIDIIKRMGFEAGHNKKAK